MSMLGVPLRVFCSVAPEDESFCSELHDHLRLLERQRVLDVWYTRLITAGTDRAAEIDTQLAHASIILLFISSSFFASDYCYGIEMQTALRRHEENEARIIPILLRPVNWETAPFAHLDVLPSTRKPLTEWGNRDTAFSNIVTGILRVIEEFTREPHVVQSHVGNLPFAHNPSFSGASPDIQERIHDYTSFINEKTRDFVGRQFVVDAFTHFTEQYPAGYVFLRGDPGIGKSAFAAHMVQMNGYVHHFNIRSEGISTTDKFLQNICAQLIARYQLDYPFLPPEAARDASFLHTLLEKVSVQLENHEKAAIIVDALDEVDRKGLASGANTLYLPMNLPPKIYFFVTMRRVPLNIRIECDHQTLDIEHNWAGNIADIHEYLTRAVGRPGIQAYITAQGIDNGLFITYLVEKSEGNFMYLRYVLPEIEHGAYKDLDLKALPSGLQNYYEDHWGRMSNKDQNSWFEYELPVIATITAVYKPVSIEFIAYITRISIARISTILVEWEQFLHLELVTEGGIQQEHYWVYHMSFHDFLAQQKSVQGELNVVQEAHRNIVRSLLQKGPKDGKLSRHTE